MRLPNTTCAVCLMLFMFGSILHAKEMPAPEWNAPLDTISVGTGKDEIQILLPKPIEVPAPKRPRYIDCRGQLLYFVPIAELKRAANDAIAKAKQQAGEDQQALMISLAKTMLQKGAFTVDLTFAILDQLALLPTEAPADCDARGLSATATNHCFVQYCKMLKPDKDSIHLIIRGSPALEIEEMRKLADALGIEIEASHVPPEGLVKFGMNDRPITGF